MKPLHVEYVKRLFNKYDLSEENDLTTHGRPNSIVTLYYLMIILSVLSLC